MTRTPTHTPSKHVPPLCDSRRRVSSACQRCRLKKCKCNGLNPCARCKTDNTICAYGNHKRSEKSVYRNEYVQMLERQQCQLIAGIHILYQSMQNGHHWTGPPLEHDTYGQPLTHKILQGLGVLGSDDWENIAATGPCLQVSGSPSPAQAHEGLDTISPSSTDSPFFSMSSISRPSSAPQPTLPANPRSDLDDPICVNDTETSVSRVSPPAVQSGRKQLDPVSQMAPPLSAYLGEHHFEMDPNFESIMEPNWMHGLDDLVNATTVSGSPLNCT